MEKLVIKENFPSRVIGCLLVILSLVLVASCSVPPEATNELPAISQTVSSSAEGIGPLISATSPDSILAGSPVPTEPPAPTSQPTQAEPTEPPPTVTAAPTATFLPAEEWRPVLVSGCPITQAPEVSEQATLDLGPSSGIPRTTAEGERLVIVGTVYASDCTPLPGASLNLWQTDANGEYGPGHDSGDLECCYLQGQVSTDENGRYQVNSVRPGHYAGQQPPPPAHIHVEVSHPGADGMMAEIVFADDPFLEENRLGGYLIVAPEPFAEADGDYSYLRAVADFVLPGPQATANPADASSVTDPTDLRTFQIQPGESEAAYHIQEKFIGISIGTKAVGVTSQLQGEIEIDLTDPQFLRSLEVEADLTQLTSGEINRDEKLADQWLVTNVYPLASFTATGTENLSQDYQEGQLVTFTLHGDMTIRDITRPQTFQVSARLDGDTLIGTATGALKMTDFGIDPPSLLDFVVVEDEVGVVVNIFAKEVDGSSGN